jgi:hypothetical protein
MSNRSSKLDASDPPNTRDTDDASDTNPRMHPPTWRERHALKVLGAVMIAMFATVIIAQVAC